MAQKLKTEANRNVLPLSPMYGIIHVVMLGSQKHISHKHVAADECVTLHILLGCNSLRVWYSSKRLQFPICCVGDIACCVVNYWVHWCYIFSFSIRSTIYSTFICWTFRDKCLRLQTTSCSFKTSHQDRNNISEKGRFPALQYASANERVPCLLKKKMQFLGGYVSPESEGKKDCWWWLCESHRLRLYISIYGNTWLNTRHKSIHQLPRDAVKTNFSTDSLIFLVGSSIFLVDPPISRVGEYLWVAARRVPPVGAGGPGQGRLQREVRNLLSCASARPTWKEAAR